MIPTGATLRTPASIMSPSCGPAPATTPMPAGIRIDATSTETRFDHTAARNSAIVTKPRPPSIIVYSAPQSLVGEIQVQQQGAEGLAVGIQSQGPGDAAAEGFVKHEIQCPDRRAF